ncbi:hypothetical protein BIW11_10920 [Tropilaelaps mercedesae]|uniref:Uncharacterized protein n=1 Tax=Tropilaelaps mercedesae TaxID=418985 RepID=A0A1V9XDC1_9ACAR|nr:hypothetical protein BIW11_10920 [Tropilaelaps mercedesae]
MVKCDRPYPNQREDPAKKRHPLGSLTDEPMGCLSGVGRAHPTILSSHVNIRALSVSQKVVNKHRFDWLRCRPIARTVSARNSQQLRKRIDE